MVFGIIPEYRSASLRNERSASPESPPCAAGSFSLAAERRGSPDFPLTEHLRPCLGKFWMLFDVVTDF
jgi:hypothetical protein